MSLQLTVSLLCLGVLILSPLIFCITYVTALHYLDRRSGSHD